MIQEMSVEFMPRDDVPVGRQAMLLLVVGNIAAIRDLGLDEDPGGRDRLGRRGVHAGRHCIASKRSAARPARRNRRRPFLGKGRTLDDGHAHATPGQRPGHHGSCWPTTDDDDVVSVTGRHLKILTNFIYGSEIATGLPIQSGHYGWPECCASYFVTRPEVPRRGLALSAAEESQICCGLSPTKTTSWSDG